MGKGESKTPGLLALENFGSDGFIILDNLKKVLAQTVWGKLLLEEVKFVAEDEKEGSFEGNLLTAVKAFNMAPMIAGTAVAATVEVGVRGVFKTIEWSQTPTNAATETKAVGGDV